MTARDEAIYVADTLDAMGIAYMFVGSFSSNFYGIERSTLDADLVIQLDDTPIAKLSERLGAKFNVDPQMSFEGVTATMRYIVTLPDNAFKIELFLLSDDPHDRERFARRRIVKAMGRNVYMPTVEDVIVTKTRWARRKDVEDLVNILAVQRGNVDWEYVYRWCDQHGMRKKLDEIRATVPEI